MDFHESTSTTQIVYLVDSDRAHLDQLEALLASEGLRTKSYISARDFLGEFRGNIPSCLVIDLDAAGAGGLDLQQQLSARQLETPIVFVANSADVAHAVTAMRRGAVDLIEKPLPRRELVLAVRLALKRDSEIREKRAKKEAVLSRLKTLTQRERETLDLIVDGLNSKEIASAFGIGLQTVAKHRSRLLTKMEVGNDAQLVRLCLSADIGLPLSCEASLPEKSPGRTRRSAAAAPHFARPNLTAALVEH